ncbi:MULTISPECIES: type II toxin-antitoxin system VapC family toxin [Thiorhodovibrio]|uniref:type II toxin-antitoxin system VapC family toxin n=1 Tax=Thiorhodovibrio TaxID=61593 RepID=UPI001913BB86|nr:MULTISPECIES: type II toxin-antitoxin system VapC family toxin [Thiorhodovibrio]MBK5970200.1 VapC toxin family PIN domain ribonuclease [Thiorhodovibrio winogradskyi]WPL13842.1 putative nucleic acid-binding protein, contains PIN domain [Thiorhodovibrio litoralis]
MSADHRAYLDTSALAKWYLNEPGSDDFVAFLQGLDVAVISSLTVTEMRSLLSRRRRMGDLPVELETLLFSAFLEDIDRGWLQRYTMDDARFAEATNLIVRHPEHPLRTLDALHLSLAAHAGIAMLATADAVMANAATSMGFEVVRF